MSNSYGYDDIICNIILNYLKKLFIIVHVIFGLICIFFICRVKVPLHPRLMKKSMNDDTRKVEWHENAVGERGDRGVDRGWTLIPWIQLHTLILQGKL